MRRFRYLVSYEFAANGEVGDARTFIHAKRKVVTEKHIKRLEQWLEKRFGFEKTFVKTFKLLGGDY